MSSPSFRACLSVVALTLLAACTQDQKLPIEPTLDRTLDRTPGTVSVEDVVRKLAAARGVTRMPRAPKVRNDLVRLGQALAFDKILSGNRDISCMTCHLPQFGTGDSRSLAIGQGASGLGPTRVHPTGAFIPRNAPPLFNLSALSSLFVDGRVSVDHGQYHTPAGTALTPEMTNVFEFGAASALGLFPVTSREEMRGQTGNELAAISDDSLQLIWRSIMQRLGKIPEYRRMFEDAYPNTKFRDMTFAHASNAIGGFLLDQFSFDDAPWDRFLDGNNRALTPEQLAGAQTFLTIKCSLCHTGPALTDNKFHNVAIAQFGPGKGNGVGGNDDFGRFNVTGVAADQYAFRTSPLRNITQTAPYGHDGAIRGLRDFIAHYSESDVKLRSFDVNTLEPLLRGTLVPNTEAVIAQRDPIIVGVVLPSTTVDQLAAFMTSLTDPAALNLNRSVPRRVPSGLTIDRP